jgi:SNF2 family DNA or RNA helicase
MSSFQPQDLYPLSLIPEVRDFIYQGIKTIPETISLCTTKNLPTIIICPKVLVDHWSRRIQTTTMNSVAILSDYDPFNLNPQDHLADFVIINYEQLEKYDQYLSHQIFSGVILDGSQYIKNLKSQRTKLVFKYFAQCPHRFCVSDEPFTNASILRFYTQLKFLRPDFYRLMINIFRQYPRP